MQRFSEQIIASRRGPSSIMNVRGSRFWTENRHVNWKFTSYFVNMENQHHTPAGELTDETP
jgi:hypothetical protein